MKNKTIFFNRWQSTGRLDAHLAKSLLPIDYLTFLNVIYPNVTPFIWLYLIKTLVISNHSSGPR